MDKNPNPEEFWKLRSKNIAKEICEYQFVRI
jgi:hypothetical protein